MMDEEEDYFEGLSKTHISQYHILLKLWCEQFEQIHA